MRRISEVGHDVPSRPDSPPLALLLLVLCGWSATAATAADVEDPGVRRQPDRRVRPARPSRASRRSSRSACAPTGFDAQVINAGLSGDTTAGGLARLDWSLAEKPDLVILELGANDMLRGIDPATVRANLDKMIGKIKASGAKLLLVGMQASPNWGKKYQKEFDRIYPELAQAHGVALYPFFLEGVAMDPELNQPDGLHPNARGVAVIVERIAPDVAKLLGGAS